MRHLKALGATLVLLVLVAGIPLGMAATIGNPLDGWAYLKVGDLTDAVVIDGGNALAAREQATDVAQQASRAGADELSPDSLRGNPTGLTASPATAQAAAQRVLDAADVTGKVTVGVAGDSVTVTVVVHKTTTILSAVGLTDISGTATATAIALHGTTTGSG